MGREPIFNLHDFPLGFPLFWQNPSQKKEEPWLVSPLSKLVPLPNGLTNSL